MSPSNSIPGCFRGLFARKDSHRRESTEGLQFSDSKALRVDTNVSYNDVKSFSPCCNFSSSPQSEWWVDNEALPLYTSTDTQSQHLSVSETVDATVDNLSSQLRRLSLQIHASPEIMFQERLAHSILTSFMQEQGFKVTTQYLGLSTAWRAEFRHGKGGRVIGINSEMDALSGMGHACGHNLIAISGVGVAIALKRAMEIHNISGKLILLGTPAEEGGGGKVILLERGAYKEMDVCIMCHPGAGPPHSSHLGSTNAMQAIEVEYFGQSAHAGAAPWEGTNALDAAFLAYSNISVLRQQIKPDHRIHGVVNGRDWAPNIIPDYAQMRWLARAGTYVDLIDFVARVQNCFEAAALATGCKIKVKSDAPYFDLHQNSNLAQAFAEIVGNRYGVLTSPAGTSASTDFGNVSYELPSLHPMFTIPTEGGNHTPAFAKAAATDQAHAATMVITKALALTGLRVLSDPEFFGKVKCEFEALAKAMPATIRQRRQ